MQRGHPIPIASAVLIGIALVALLAFAPGSARSDNPSLCTYGGIRYVGTTAQKKNLCFTLNIKGTAMREYAYEYADTCGTGTTHAVNPRGGVTLVPKTGIFNRVTFDGFFKGVIKAGKASGTLRQFDQDTIIGKGAVSCDTHVIRWTAKRVG